MDTRNVCSLILACALGVWMAGCGHVTVLHLVKDDNTVENGVLDGPVTYNETNAPRRIDVNRVGNTVQPGIIFELYAQSKDRIVGMNYEIHKCNDLGGIECRMIEWGCKYGAYTMDAAGHFVWPELLKFDRTTACGSVTSPDDSKQPQQEGKPLIVDFNKGAILKLIVRAYKDEGEPMTTGTVYFNATSVKDVLSGGR